MSKEPLYPHVPGGKKITEPTADFKNAISL
jgi:hypothetical protein